ncbi:UDP-N-acetylmuramoyl-L-alanine--D-glutamate ligase [Aliidiomarina celeris]|uniref:UDP-N-acetylmuramoyl-L-alanine--D-glutamate ligase n=1 Tax=Aliidiomarina celeris TaxID=2249428 RepID=UPI000DEBCA13|nr:UDP-N-acetylmuramoyl-L-alanine--D-glutamate ligase [Aliidiomarina celeris]
MERNLAHYQTVAVAGFGQTGASCARFLLRQGITPLLMDSRQLPPGLQGNEALLERCECYFGGFVAEQVLSADLIIVSPGLDTRTGPLRMAADAGIPLISDIELFAWYVAVPVVAVTGSNGKSTVTELTRYLLEQSGKRAAMGGNIGVPALDLLDPEVNYDCIVLELSSFQLELTETLALEAACILNISPDHLDRYDDERSYQRAKHRIYRNARYRVWNSDDPLTKPRKTAEAKAAVTAVKSRMLKFGSGANPDGLGLQHDGSQHWLSWRGMRLLQTDQLPLAGKHNWLNVMAALGLCHALELDPSDALKLIQGFKPLAHRCEVVKQQFGVRWIDDSKATNVGATVAAIEGLRADVKGRLVLIAGGDAKGADMRLLDDPLRKVDLLITLGRDGDRIAGLRADAVKVDSLPAAVEYAYHYARAGDTVLLSPACASLDMFNDYRHRGQVFRQAVEARYATS